MEPSGQCQAPAAPLHFPGLGGGGTAPSANWSRGAGLTPEPFGTLGEDNILPLGVHNLYPSYTVGDVMALVNTALTELCEMFKLQCKGE